MESTNQLEQVDNVNIFVAPKQVVKEMRIYLRMDEVQLITVQIEDLKETVINECEDIDEDEEDEREEVVKQKTTKMLA